MDSAPVPAASSSGPSESPEPSATSSSPKFFYSSCGWVVLDEEMSADSATTRARMVGTESFVHLPRSTLVESIDVEFSTFYQQQSGPLHFTLNLSASTPLSTLVKQVASKLSELKIAVEEEVIRLVNCANGKEIETGAKKSRSSPTAQPVAASSSTRCLAEIGLRKPFKMLIVIDDFSRFVFDRNSLPDCITLDSTNTQATIHTDSRWFTVRGDRGFDSGKFFFKIRIKSLQGGCCFFL